MRNGGICSQKKGILGVLVAWLVFVDVFSNYLGRYPEQSCLGFMFMLC